EPSWRFRGISIRRCCSPRGRHSPKRHAASSPALRDEAATSSISVTAFFPRRRSSPRRISSSWCTRRALGEDGVLQIDCRPAPRHAVGVGLTSGSLPRFLFTGRALQVVAHLPDFVRLYWR